MSHATAPPSARFDELAARWVDASDDRALAEIVAIGEPAIRLVLAELAARPGPWDVVLRALTGEDPVPPEERGDPHAEARAWLAWGRQEEADMAEALRITPGIDRLRALVARGASAEGADLDADPADLY